MGSSSSLPLRSVTSVSKLENGNLQRFPDLLQGMIDRGEDVVVVKTYYQRISSHKSFILHGYVLIKVEGIVVDGRVAQTPHWIKAERDYDKRAGKGRITVTLLNEHPDSGRTWNIHELEMRPDSRIRMQDLKEILERPPSRYDIFVNNCWDYQHRVYCEFLEILAKENPQHREFLRGAIGKVRKYTPILKRYAIEEFLLNADNLHGLLGACALICLAILIQGFMYISWRVSPPITWLRSSFKNYFDLLYWAGFFALPVIILLIIMIIAVPAYYLLKDFKKATKDGFSFPNLWTEFYSNFQYNNQLCVLFKAYTYMCRGILYNGFMCITWSRISISSWRVFPPLSWLLSSRNFLLSSFKNCFKNYFDLLYWAGIFALLVIILLIIMIIAIPAYYLLKNFKKATKDGFFFSNLWTESKAKNSKR